MGSKGGGGDGYRVGLGRKTHLLLGGRGDNWGGGEVWGSLKPNSHCRFLLLDPTDVATYSFFPTGQFSQR